MSETGSQDQHDTGQNGTSHPAPGKAPKPTLAIAIGAVLGEAGFPLYAIDLRSADEVGPVADWLASSLPMRSIGAVYSHRTAERWYRPTVLAEQFDVLFFLEQTTPARPNPLTRKRHGIDDD